MSDRKCDQKSAKYCDYLQFVSDRGHATIFSEALVYLVKHNASLSCCRVGDMLILVGL